MATRFEKDMRLSAEDLIDVLKERKEEMANLKKEGLSANSFRGKTIARDLVRLQNEYTILERQVDKKSASNSSRGAGSTMSSNTGK